MIMLMVMLLMLYIYCAITTSGHIDTGDRHVGGVTLVILSEHALHCNTYLYNVQYYTHIT